MSNDPAIRVERLVAASIGEEGVCPSTRRHAYTDEVLHCCLPVGHGTTGVLPEQRWHYGWSRDGGQYAWQGSDEDGFAEDAQDAHDESHGAKGEG